MRRRLAAVVLAVCLADAAVSTAAAPRVQFPRDHFGHPGSSIEWWYSSALTRDAAGTRYLVFFALFSSGGNVLAVHQVTNLATGAIVDHGEEPGSAAWAPRRSTSMRAPARLVLAADEHLVLLGRRPRARRSRCANARRSPTRCTAAARAGSGSRWRARRSTTPRRGWPPSGSFGDGGKTVALTGQSWLDHQWGDFRDDPRGFNWDWFSCRFDDGTELMLYQFRDRQTGRPLDRYRTGTWVPANGTAHGITGFAADHGRRALRGRRAHVAARLAPEGAVARDHRDGARGRPRPARPEHDPAHVLGGRVGRDRVEEGHLRGRALLPLSVADDRPSPRRARPRARRHPTAGCE